MKVMKRVESNDLTARFESGGAETSWPRSGCGSTRCWSRS
ncbi:hypothetical protein ACFTAO_09330 [Paenibacillus rhizoplanae]